MNELTVIKGVECYIDQDGIVQLNLEHVARGLGFTEAKGNYVRWQRVQGYLEEFQFSTSGEKAPTYIPEPIFYLLAMKANNDTAKQFQKTVAYEILPSIRKHGLYATEELLNDPDLAIKAFTALKEEREKNNALKLLTSQQSQIINELKPKADYTDSILRNKGLVTITQIAKDYGMTGQAMNDLLHTLKIQYKQSEQWLLYREHQDKGYTHSETINIIRKGGIPDITMNTKWTQKGRLFIYGLLKGVGVLPLIEKIA